MKFYDQKSTILSESILKEVIKVQKIYTDLILTLRDNSEIRLLYDSDSVCTQDLNKLGEKIL